MKTYLITLLCILTFNLFSQNDKDWKKFTKILDNELSQIPFGKIEKHYEEGFFICLEENEYSEKDGQIGLSSLFALCFEKSKSECHVIIQDYFERFRLSNIENKYIQSKISDFDFMKSYLAIRVYPKEWSEYFKDAIIDESIEGLISVVIINSTYSAVSLSKDKISSWSKTEEEVLKLAKENTLQLIPEEFEFAQKSKYDDKIYLIASDTNIFLSSALINLEEQNIPNGKFGTLISVPNFSAVVAIPISSKQNLDEKTLDFMGLTNYMFESNETKPLSDNLYWYYENKIYLIEKDEVNKKLLLPKKLKEL